MKKSFSLSKKIYYVTLCALLIFALSLIVTGSWFTDSGSIKGDLTKPEIQPTVVYKDNNSYVEFGDNNCYWTSDADNKEIYVKFDTANTVKNQICRVVYSITWGTLENGVWTPKTFQPVDSLSLSPVNFDKTKWIKGVNMIEDMNAAVDSWLTENGITNEDLTALGMTRSDVIASIIQNINGPITMYYYSNVINIDSVNYIKICDGFKFDSTNYDATKYAGLTAKISVMAEANSVSDSAIGTIEKSGDTIIKQGGDWIYNPDGSFKDDRPSDELVTNWKNSI